MLSPIIPPHVILDSFLEQKNIFYNFHKYSNILEKMCFGFYQRCKKDLQKKLVAKAKILLGA